jgi:iron complex outermembrane receptor protein
MITFQDVVLLKYSLSFIRKDSMIIPAYRFYKMFLRSFLKVVIILSAAVFQFIAVVHCPASNDGARARNLSEMSLEELMNVEVTSVSRQSEKMTEAAAAVFVITPDDISRSGATNIPELLRMVPGIQVAHINANTWAITSRGFDSRFSNKLLVLIDGRSVYTPLFSGVYWDVQDVMLEDVERIEVIRGPGSTLWGANAVNGVINIITKGAQDTQGGLVTAGGGNQEKGFASARYGAKIGESTYLRVYSKYFERNRGFDPSGTKAADDWRMQRAGFRMDVTPYGADSFTLQGDIYGGSAGQTLLLADVNPPYSRTVYGDADVSGGNILGRWTHNYADMSRMSFQLYYDRTNRTEPIGREGRDTFDLDFQHSFRLADVHRVIWGLGYRLTRDSVDDTFNVMLDPDSKTDNLFSAFVQDDISVIRDRLRFIIGSKFEHNDYTGFEIQPNARILWTPDNMHTLWAAVSRAVRTPSRAESDARINAGVLPPAFPGAPISIVSYIGNKDLGSERLIAYEAGLRKSLAHNVYMDIATFYNVYSNIGLFRAGTPAFEASPLPPHIVIPLYYETALKGRSYGVETAVDWKAASWWKMQLAYTLLELKLESANNGVSDAVPGSSPHNQISLRSNMDAGKNVEMDLWFRYVDKAAHTSAYATMDARIGWKPTRNLTLEIVGQNLFDNHHPEFNADIIGINQTEVERGFYGRVTCRF